MSPKSPVDSFNTIAPLQRFLPQEQIKTKMAPHPLNIRFPLCLVGQNADHFDASRITPGSQQLDSGYGPPPS